MAGETRDYYELLEVSRTATSDEIKRSFRRLARELHPDANPDDPTAEARFREVAVAYETLSDPERRQRYDRYGPDADAMAGAGFSGGLSDLFDAFFGGNPFGGDPRSRGPARGPDLEAVIDLSFEEAVFGTQAPVSVGTAVPCDDCEATGAAPGSSAVTCPDCGGSGQVQRVRQSLLGQMMTTSACPRCGALGTVIDQPCPTCGGEGRRRDTVTYTVDVPPGIDDGSTLRLTGRGAAGVRGGGLGDLYVHVRVRPHDRFVRHGNDLAQELHVSMVQAALGTHLDLETLDGTEDLVIPRGTQTGQVFRLRNQGVPQLHGRGRGDLLVQVVVDTPTELTDAEVDALRAFGEGRGEHLVPVDESLLSKLRSAFR